MPQETFLVAAVPRQLHLLRGAGVVPAHLAYRIGPGCRLQRLRCSPPPWGGKMVLADGGVCGDWDALLREVLNECRLRAFSGVILDFERRRPPLERLTARLEELLGQRGLSLTVPEAYGPCARRAGVIIPSPLSGGSLEQRLEEACRRFGQGRTVLSLEPAAEDFLLPAPSGCGTPLSPEGLSALRGKLKPSVFFSRELCARYFTYSDGAGAHFVLFDDGDTLCRKVETARQAGVRTFLLPCPLLADLAAALGIAGPG